MTCCCWNMTSLIVEMQADLAALKESISRHHAVAELPYITSNDIVAGLTWLLECEHQVCLEFLAALLVAACQILHTSSL